MYSNSVYAPYYKTLVYLHHDTECLNLFSLQIKSRQKVEKYLSIAVLEFHAQQLCALHTS